MLHVGHEDLSRYKLVIVPGMYFLDEASCTQLRAYVEAGGTVVMTAQSAKVDDHNQWFRTPPPGGLTDVSGCAPTSSLARAICRCASTTARLSRPQGGQCGSSGARHRRGAGALRQRRGPTPALTVNRFGKGRAIYLATVAQAPLLAPLYERLFTELGITPGPRTPEGVSARVVQGRLYVVNTTNEPRDVPIEGTQRGLLSGQTWTGTLKLPGFGAELLQAH